ncbi:hypothetical protein ABH900_002684 [Stenotrophomonas sp. AN71]|uniref:hypothetical protein n=1 Tax=Stenotrophomonas sp. AN71 TaxID=3156253 RepID=UPI003D22C7DD
MFRLLLLMSLLLSGGCAHHLGDRPATAPGYFGNDQAVRAAQDDPTAGITGTFALTVQALGTEDGHLYLNSERDYRHPLNITLDIDATLRPELEEHLGLKLERLQDRHLLVNGTARRVRIAFFDSAGRQSRKYYYQTHIRVSDARQLRFAP